MQQITVERQKTNPLGRSISCTSLWRDESGWADIWRSWSSSAELSAAEQSDRKTSIGDSCKQMWWVKCQIHSVASAYLGDLGLLSDLGFPSRLLPVDLVSVNPASELVCQPEKPEAAPVSQLSVTGLRSEWDVHTDDTVGSTDEIWPTTYLNVVFKNRRWSQDFKWVTS